MQYYTVISCINVIALLLLDYIIRKNNVTSIKVKHYFRLSILATIVIIAAEIVAVYFESAPVYYRVPNIIINIIGFSISPFIPLLIGHAISHRNNKEKALFWIPAVINLILSILSSQFPIIFWVSLDNEYYRSNLFWVYIVAYVLAIIYLFIETVHETKRYQNEDRSVLFFLFLFLVLGTSVQVAMPQIRVSMLCITFTIGLYYTYYSELYHQIDGLTELLNRHAYERYISKLKYEKDAAILIFDIDDFKSINDKYGHPYGDICLTMVSLRIKEIFTKIGLCFRIGGDEFCVICKNTERAIIENASKKFLSELEKMRKSETRFPMVSVGLSFYRREIGTFEEAIIEADRKMYEFKQSRKKEA